jgi:PAS domain S-box-containing protein
MRKAKISPPLTLRDRAEEQLRVVEEGLYSHLSEIDILKLCHELQVHQIELELQNEELIIAKEIADNSARKYSKLFDTSPIGYFTLSRDGDIEGLNLFGAKTLGRERSKLRNCRFALFLSKTSLPVFTRFLDRIFTYEGTESCEVTLDTRSGKPMNVYLSGIADKGEVECSVILSDITERKKSEETIRKNEAVLRLFVEHTPAAIAMFDTNMRYIVASHRFRTDFDLGEINLVGRSHYEIFPEISERWKEIHNRCLRGATERCEEDPFPRLSGKLDWIRWEICPWYEDSGKIGGIILFSEVVTARKLAEKSLTESQNRYSSLYNSIDEGFCVMDVIFDEKNKPVDWMYVDVNPAFEKQTGIKAAQGRKIRELAPELEEYWFEIYGKIALTGESVRFINRAEQLNRWFDVFAFRLGPEENRQVAALFHNITEHIKTAEEIAKSREQLAQLYTHLSEVREEERTSIAREIHDDLGQSLAGLKIDLLGVKENIHDKVWSKHRIDKAISLVNSTIKTVQSLSSRLRPQMLDDLGLASAIEWQANEYKKRTGIKCKLELEEIEGLEEKIPISVFRIFQAALTNIMVHSKAKSVSVKLALKDEILVLKIIDDGIGITQEQINSSKSFGIIGMHERANQINGRFELHTEKGKGTEILVTVPVKIKKESL